MAADLGRLHPVYSTIQIPIVQKSLTSISSDKFAGVLTANPLTGTHSVGSTPRHDASRGGVST